MKKSYFFFAVVALVALVAGCKKDQELVTLGAVIESPSKTYINDSRYPCWHNGDKVYINTSTYTISAASGPSAQIVDVVSADAYRAVFPACIVTPGSDITNSTGIPVTLPSAQTYTVDDEGHQRVDAPMGAYITSGTTLGFHNLCSIVRVVVNNSTGSDLSVGSIILKTSNARLSGTGTASIDGTAESSITMDGTASHSVSLRIPSESPVTVSTTPVSFDIVVPGFSTDNITITINTTDGKYFELTKNNVALVHNTVTTVTLNVTSLTDIVAAELVDGETFNAAIPDNATAVVFEYNNSTVTSGTLLSIDGSVPIYGILDGTTWRISTAARMMNANQGSYLMFSGKSNLLSIDFGDGFNTSNVTNMFFMFNGCRSLTRLDLSSFNTSSVTNMSHMFQDCRGLTSLDVSHLTTSTLMHISGMFPICSRLTSLHVSHFSTSSVTDMGGMFYYCSGLTSLDLSNFNTTSVTDMHEMFYYCSGLTSLDLSNFNTTSVTDMSGMFGYCSGMTSLNISNFNTTNVTNMSTMFYRCSGLTSLNLSNFNTSSVTNMGSMFYDCYGLTSLNVSSFSTSSVTNMKSMFEGCYGLTSLDVSSFRTSSVTDMRNMFFGCHGLTSLDVSRFNTSSVTDMSYMFMGCRGLSSLNVSNFNTTSVTNMRCMFDACSGLTSLDLSNFITSSVTNMSAMFYYCRGLTSLNLANFNMSYVTNKSEMCNNLSTISGNCTITCSETVQSALESGTDLPTSGVTFTWVRP